MDMYNNEEIVLGYRPLAGLFFCSYLVEAIPVNPKYTDTLPSPIGGLILFIRKEEPIVYDRKFEKKLPSPSGASHTNFGTRSTFRTGRTSITVPFWGFILILRKVITKDKNYITKELSSPYGVFLLFIWKPNYTKQKITLRYRPLLGFFLCSFKIKNCTKKGYQEAKLPSPLGVFLLFIYENYVSFKRRASFVTVPYWGFSFFHVILTLLTMTLTQSMGYRPLLGFFFCS